MILGKNRILIRTDDIIIINTNISLVLIKVSDIVLNLFCNLPNVIKLAKRGAGIQTQSFPVAML